VRRAAAAAALVAVLAGCGSERQRSAPKPPRLPRALARTWAQEAQAVAAALAASDGCRALSLATQLRSQVTAAVNAHHVPSRFQEPLSSGVNDLASRITCAPAPPPAPARGKGHGKGHGRHGKGARD
jgi:hypothetical protein